MTASGGAPASAPGSTVAPWRIDRSQECGATAAPAGFRAAGVAAGLKASGALDVALVLNEGPRSDAAAVFTANRVRAAPVIWSEQCVRAGHFRAVVLNSGGANACTGPEGFADTHRSAEHVADRLGIGAIEVAICSTGLIGLRLPMPALLAGIDQAVTLLAEGADGSPGQGGPVPGATAGSATGLAAARAIMTTDSVPKVIRVEHASGWLVGGMAKGAGMLAPGLATMLVVLTTDAVADPEDLDHALRSATATTFDRIDSDGCMSTNDTVLLLASGASGIRPAAADLVEGVRLACADLARQLIADAEGASKDIRIDVVGAATVDDALTAARAVSRSNLFKCAVHGEDPNWGRILAAVGTTHARFEPDDLAVSINGALVCRNGAAHGDRDDVDMSAREVVVTVDLGAGVESATIWTNDLTALYVHENSAYST